MKMLKIRCRRFLTITLGLRYQMTKLKGLIEQGALVKIPNAILSEIFKLQISQHRFLQSSPSSQHLRGTKFVIKAAVKLYGARIVWIRDGIVPVKIYNDCIYNRIEEKPCFGRSTRIMQIVVLAVVR